MAETKEKWRANYVPAPNYFALNHACVIVNRALDGFGCYLVGSSLERRDYRDVDVRFMMEDDAFDRLFRCTPENADQGAGGWLNPLWSLMCTSISGWMSAMTGLPIDFQIQRQTQANEKHDGRRSALGIFLDYPGERPSDTAPAPTTVGVDPAVPGSERTVRVIKLDGKVVGRITLGPQDGYVPPASEGTYEERNLADPNVTAGEVAAAMAALDDDDYEAFASRLRGFERANEPNSSTIVCKCGEWFTWASGDEGLRAWVDEHHPHLDGARVNEPRPGGGARFTHTGETVGDDDRSKADHTRGPWRIGRTLGRTLYFHDRFVGAVDTPGLAIILVTAANERVAARGTDKA